MDKNSKYWGFYGAERSDQRHNTTKVLVRRQFYYLNIRVQWLHSSWLEKEKRWDCDVKLIASSLAFACGSIHQGVDRFTTESRGQQCMFMSCASLFFNHTVMPVTTWDSQTTDQIVVHGDSMYRKALANGRIPYAETLTVEWLSTSCSKMGHRQWRSYEIGKIARCDWGRGGGYLGQVLLGMCRWPLRTPTPL